MNEKKKNLHIDAISLWLALCLRVSVCKIMTVLTGAAAVLKFKHATITQYVALLASVQIQTQPCGNRGETAKRSNPLKLSWLVTHSNSLQQSLKPALCHPSLGMSWVLGSFFFRQCSRKKKKKIISSKMFSFTQRRWETDVVPMPGLVGCHHKLFKKVEEEKEHLTHPVLKEEGGRFLKT